MSEINPKVISALSNGTVVYFFPELPAIEVRGPGAQSFLHRISTNNVNAMLAGQSIFNIFVTAKGRVVDLVHQVAISLNDMLLVPSVGKSAGLLNWLEQYHFGEDLELNIVKMSGAMVIGRGFAATKTLYLPTFNYLDDNLEPVPAFLALAANNVELKSILPTNYLEIGFDEWETLRIAALIPSVPNELCEKYNPLELNLQVAVHLNKGCYVGQEVLARIDTYHKLTKALTGLHVKQRKPMNVGQKLTRERRVIGTVTSVAPLSWSTRHFSALGIEKK